MRRHLLDVAQSNGDAVRRINAVILYREIPVRLLARALETVRLELEHLRRLAVVLPRIVRDAGQHFKMMRQLQRLEMIDERRVQRAGEILIADVHQQPDAAAELVEVGGRQLLRIVRGDAVLGLNA